MIQDSGDGEDDHDVTDKAELQAVKDLLMKDQRILPTNITNQPSKPSWIQGQRTFVSSSVEYLMNQNKVII